MSSKVGVEDLLLIIRGKVVKEKKVQFAFNVHLPLLSNSSKKDPITKMFRTDPFQVINSWNCRTFPSAIFLHLAECLKSHSFSKIFPNHNHILGRPVTASLSSLTPWTCYVRLIMVAAGKCDPALWSAALANIPVNDWRYMSNLTEFICLLISNYHLEKQIQASYVESLLCSVFKTWQEFRFSFLQHQYCACCNF